IASASFDFGLPLEDEPNGTLGNAHALPVGAYMYGTIASNNDADVYRIRVAAPTTVLVETDAYIGACGLAGQVDTVVRLLDAGGALVVENDDIDSDTRRRCSRIHATLSAGTYYAEVTGWSGSTGAYGVRVARIP